MTANRKWDIFKLLVLLITCTTVILHFIWYKNLQQVVTETLNNKLQSIPQHQYVFNTMMSYNLGSEKLPKRCWYHNNIKQVINLSPTTKDIERSIKSCATIFLDNAPTIDDYSARMQLLKQANIYTPPKS